MASVREFDNVNQLFDVVDEHILATRRIKPTMEVVGKTLAKRAQDKIGHPNAPVGPFPGWQPLADSTIADRHSKGFMDDSKILERTGELRAAIESSAGEEWAQAGVRAGAASSDGRDLGMIAFSQEFGSLRIPPRPFLGPALFENSRRVVQIVASGIIRVLRR